MLVVYILSVIMWLISLCYTFVVGITIAYEIIPYTKTPLWLEKVYDFIWFF